MVTSGDNTRNCRPPASAHQMSRERRTILLLAVVIPTVACLATAAVCAVVTYRWTVREHMDYLRGIATSMAAMIDAVAQFDAQFSNNDHPDGARGATLAQVEHAYARLASLGDTEEMVMALGGRRNPVSAPSVRRRQCQGECRRLGWQTG